MFSLLDAFCGAGGAARGYQDAGFAVWGVDQADQPVYPGERFLREDAVQYITDHGGMFHVVHASPPCQHDCTLTAGTNARSGRRHPDLLQATLAALQSTGRPWILEQPPGRATARMRALYGEPTLTLCGEMFGLGVIRHRNFWIDGLDVARPEHRPHRGRVNGWRHGRFHPGPYVAVYGDGGGKGSVAQWRAAMDIDWIEDRRSLAEALPPAYTRYIGRNILPCL